MSFFKWHWVKKLLRNWYLKFLIGIKYKCLYTVICKIIPNICFSTDFIIHKTSGAGRPDLLLLGVYFKPQRPSIGQTFQFLIFHQLTHKRYMMYVYFFQIFLLLVGIIAFLEALTVFAMVEVYDWNNVMNQIVYFHEQHPDVPVPNLSTDLLGIPYHYIWTFLVDFAYINLVIGISMICLDVVRSTLSV